MKIPSHPVPCNSCLGCFACGACPLGILPTSIVAVGLEVGWHILE